MTGWQFSVPNRRDAGCGEALEIDGDERGAYVGYFENALGESAVYVFDGSSGVATVRMGDAGWACRGAGMAARSWTGGSQGSSSARVRRSGCALVGW